jgi:hypothetical protein
MKNERDGKKEREKEVRKIKLKRNKDLYKK